MVQFVHMPQDNGDSDRTQALIQMMHQGREDQLVMRAQAHPDSFDADYLEDSNNALENFTRGTVDLDGGAGGDDDGAGSTASESAAKVDLIESDGEEDFNCTAGNENWTRGWSLMKKRYCCRTAGIGCEPESSNTSGNGSSFNSSSNGSSIDEGGNTSRRARRPRRPRRPRNAQNDTFGNVTNATAVRKAKCVTKDDPQANSWAYTTSPAGTYCVFGVDERDEGWHCIFEGNKYAYGWCFTSKSRDTWGSCDESCPLVGQAKQIGNVIRGAKEELKKAISQEVGQAFEKATRMAIAKAEDWINQTNGSFKITFTAGAQTSSSEGTATNSSSSNSSNISNSKETAFVG